MHGIACGQLRVAQHNLFRTLYGTLIHGEDLIRDSKYRIESRLNKFPAIQRYIAVQNLLEHFRVGYQPFSIADEPFQHMLRIGLVRVWRPNEIHRNIRIHKDQGSDPVP